MSKELETKLRELRDRLMFEESDTANVMNLLDDCITLAASQQPPAGQVTVEELMLLINQNLFGGAENMERVLTAYVNGDKSVIQ